ncbi:MAG: YARHG domain-containing protein [Bacteroidota bacterium]
MNYKDHFTVSPSDVINHNDIPEEMKRSATILGTIWILLLTACTGNFNTSPSTQVPEVKEDVKARQIHSAKQFSNFLRAISLKPGTIANEKIREFAKMFLPDSTIHLDHHLYARLIPSPDSTHLLYYEYSTDDGSEGNAYLGIFSNDGETIDILPLKEVSYDGSVTINMLDDNILELEYYDFYKVDELYKSESLTDHQETEERPVWQKVSIKNFREDNSIVEFYYYENYRINKRNFFTKLQRTDSINLERNYPQSSLRILSRDELERYSNKELRMMINEIYASHGFIFRSEDLYHHFQRKNWYRPKHYNVDGLLSDIERINIRRIASKEQQAK